MRENRANNVMGEKARSAIALVLSHEGGYVNDRNDPGGETKFGISKRSYPSLNIPELTRTDAEQIYFRDWWIRYGYEMITDQLLAMKVLDLAVNMGPGQLARLLQVALRRSGLNGIEVDGVLGPLSIEAVNEHPHVGFLRAELKLAAIEYYVGLKRKEYLAGWIRRVLDDGEDGSIGG